MALKKSFTVTQLQNIGLYCSVLRECNGVKPFSLAIKLNNCAKAADQAVKEAQEQLNLITQRGRTTDDMNEETVKNIQQQQVEDAKELMTKLFEIEIPEISEREFESLEIDGEKTVPKFDGNGLQTGTYQVSNRQAYFNLLGTIIQS